MGHDLSDQRERIVAVVQARMRSARLPGKVLTKLGDDTALELLLRRLARSTELDAIVVATSTDPSDDAVEREARRLAVRALRGPLEDVLARYVQACDLLEPSAVVRITADCPLIDSEVVDQVVRHWRATRADYVANTVEPRSYPDGLDVEVIAADALRRAGKLARSAADREHVTTYIRRHPDAFTWAEVRLEPSFGSVRITLDTATDLRFLEDLIGEIGPDAPMRHMLEALGFDGAVTVRYGP
jgi:spore coat polysaccharide biosynthesis protein SpsF (cytidylyltransferase family)